MIELNRRHVLKGAVAAAAGTVLEKHGSRYRLVPVRWNPV